MRFLEEDKDHTLASLCLHSSSFFSLVRNHMGMLSR